MYGNQIGRLTLQFGSSSGRFNQLWERRGNQGNRWHRTRVEGEAFFDMRREEAIVSFIA